MKAYIERMKDESYELVMKISKLNDFLNQNLRDLDKTEKYLMRRQLESMGKYLCILDARIDHAVLKENQREMDKEEE